MKKKLFLVNLQKQVGGRWSHISRVRTVSAVDDADLKEQIDTEYRPIKEAAPDFRARIREVQVIEERFMP